MFGNDFRVALAVAHEHAQRLGEEMEAARFGGASELRRAFAASLRRAAQLLDPAPLTHRTACR